MLKGKKLYAKLPLGAKKAWILVLLSLKEERYSTESDKDYNCSGCEKEINQIKEFAPNLNVLKRRHANLAGHMLPWCVNDLDEYLQRLSI